MLWLTAVVVAANAVSASYWLGSVAHRGKHPFNPDASYTVFRDVKNDFGAVGDGIHDDTQAIMNAMTAGTRCGITCESSTVSPAVVYFPPGTYLVSQPIIQYYYTQMIGDATDLPTLKASSSFNLSTSKTVIDSDPYKADPNGGLGGVNWWVNQNNFFRSVRNFKIDLTGLPADSGITGIHWQVSQATSLQNIVFNMAPVVAGQKNTQRGLFMENGSGGFFSDLTFNGGAFGMVVGNQQFTTRALTFNDVDTAIQFLWDWTWVLKSVAITNSRVGISMEANVQGDQKNLTIGSVILMDSTMSNVQTGIVTAFDVNGGSAGYGGTLHLDNVKFDANTPIAVSAKGATVLAGDQLVASWGQGNVYNGNTITRTQGTLPVVPKPPALLSGSNFFERNKPLYENLPVSSVLSAKANGAKGDGATDDTAAIQALLIKAAASGQVVFFDHGVYVVSNTVDVPSGARIAGEIWPIIMVNGVAFQDASAPVPVFRVGKPGDKAGSVEISDLIFETAGPQPGAILVEWNLPASAQGSNGMWEVHARVGGSTGQLQTNKCAEGTTDFAGCSGAFMLLHVTKNAGVYLENTWWWTADHDLDAVSQGRVSIYTGRGVLIESQNAVWLYGTSSEHNQLYQYQFNNAANIFAALLQIETAYYQGSVTNALSPFKPNASYNDPTFSNCAAGDSACLKGWGLRAVNTRDTVIYGAGLYSFFDNYKQGCLTSWNCQSNMVSLEKSSVSMVGLTTIGTTNMLLIDGTAVGLATSNLNVKGSSLEFVPGKQQSV
ncbi:glucan 1,3-beta-glucosidase [Chytriomyces sp. MP71]|nr:glucan 1,3-beta-glucosidase [Chytriomyces sp. MP71]